MYKLHTLERIVTLAQFRYIKLLLGYKFTYWTGGRCISRIVYMYGPQLKACHIGTRHISDDYCECLCHPFYSVLCLYVFSISYSNSIMKYLRLTPPFRAFGNFLLSGNMYAMSGISIIGWERVYLFPLLTTPSFTI
ncbi:hypothetical protein BDA99DRAFT_540048 [Phascolomyces articulosus]|uniref:Uncharacterized protein n=1 Tax=Phascolomyces articulosus TaxID=60185 RepID=A0AAD5JUU9_9FUNG|nr:hypothetical protein BDA99DRAFT_540048 [Phascolomyces articulosus]